MKSLFVIVALATLAQPVSDTKKAEPAIDQKFCQQMADYKPSADVDFKPGVDVHGKPVVEPDLNPSPVKLPEKITFDVTVDMAGTLGLAVPQGLEGDARLGTITFEKGVLSFNGEPMDGLAAAALRDMCAPKKIEKKADNIKHNKD